MRLKVFPAEPQEQKPSISNSNSTATSTSSAGGASNDQKCKRPKLEDDLLS